MSEPGALERAIAEALAPVVAAQVRAAVAEHLDSRPETYSIEDVARMLRIGKDTVHKLLKADLLWKLPLPTSTVRIPRVAVEQFLARPAGLTQRALSDGD